ncbi:hypothetical protein [Actinoplanes sp. NPDC026619]|uniref:hypothetical protein n=1 Tax=Actinoplanes sp. NPDC026619 TaxID=3155798 RepID=UPI003405E160
MTDFSVDPSDLVVLAWQMQNTSDDIQHLGQNFAMSISGPKDMSVLGDADAAAAYADVANEWVENISKLVLSVGEFSERVKIAATVYAQTESTNTVRDQL